MADYLNPGGEAINQILFQRKSISQSLILLYSSKKHWVFFKHYESDTFQLVQAKDSNLYFTIEN